MGVGDSREWDPDIARAWVKVGAAFVAAGIGAFMLIWQTVFVPTASALLVGAGLVALGVPPALIGDSKLRSKSGGDE